jgi:hypothetical protein
MVAQSQPKNTKSRRSKSPLLDRASTYVPPTWQNGSRCRFASSRAHKSSWPNPHSTRGTAAAHIPRFPALALFGRRLPQRVDSIVMPASENLHNCGLMQRSNCTCCVNRIYYLFTTILWFAFCGVAVIAINHFLKG